MKSSSVLLQIPILITGLILLFTVSCVDQSDSPKPVHLEAYAHIDKAARDEVSGIIKSKKYDDVFWIHGDSGTEPVIYPINSNGALVSVRHNNGVELKNAENKDWEEIATDNMGNLIVADIGNNCLCRDDLSLFHFPEPDVEAEVQSDYQQTFIRYPKTLNNDENNPPDAEALFYRDGSIYIITKVDVSDATRLYKLTWPIKAGKEREVHTLALLDSFHFDNQVTAADLSENGDTLAVLTSSSVWLFTHFEGEDFFGGTSRKMRFKAEQVESVTFTGVGSLLVAEEAGQLYEISLSDLE